MSTVALFGAAGKIGSRIAQKLRDDLDHLRILFGYIDAQVSDGARLAVERARKSIFCPDWMRVFAPENVMDEVKAITQARTMLTGTGGILAG